MRDNELPNDVFLALVTAYRDARGGQLIRMWPGLEREQFRQKLDADCEGWRQRYAAAVARRLAAAPGDPLP